MQIFLGGRTKVRECLRLKCCPSERKRLANELYEKVYLRSQGIRSYIDVSSYNTKMGDNTSFDKELMLYIV